MMPTLLPWLIAFLFFAFYWIIEIIYIQTFPSEGRFRFLNVLCIVLTPLAFIASLLIQRSYPLAMQANPYWISCIEAIVYFSMIYFFSSSFYALVEHSVRVRITVELYRAQGKPITYEDLFANYQPDQAIINRLEQLIRGGYVERVAEGFRLTTQGKNFVARALKIREFLKMQYEY